MDVYEICKLYNCGICAGQNVTSYQGQAYKNLMQKCSGPSSSREQYFWKSKCSDGIPDCPNGEDENRNNPKCFGNTCCSQVRVYGLKKEALNQKYSQNGTFLHNRAVYVDAGNKYGIWFDTRNRIKGNWIVGGLKRAKNSRQNYPTNEKMCPNHSHYPRGGNRNVNRFSSHVKCVS